MLPKLPEVEMTVAQATAPDRSRFFVAYQKDLPFRRRSRRSRKHVRRPTDSSDSTWLAVVA